MIRPGERPESACKPDHAQSLPSAGMTRSGSEGVISARWLETITGTLVDKTPARTKGEN